MDYELGGNWYFRTVVNGTTFAGDSVPSTTEVFSDHQIAKFGSSFGQIINTWVP
jgi:hypothetical protein